MSRLFWNKVIRQTFVPADKERKQFLDKTEIKDYSKIYILDAIGTISKIQFTKKY